MTAESFSENKTNCAMRITNPVMNKLKNKMVSHKFPEKLQSQVGEFTPFLIIHPLHSPHSREFFLEERVGSMSGY